MGAKLSYPTVDMSGRVVVVTGGNAGVGYATAKVVATMGAHTIIASRSREKSEAAVEQMKQEIATEHPDKEVKVEYMMVDLSSFRSVKDFTVAFREKNLPLHVLINNAGVAGSTRVITAEGYELHYQANHLSPFLLTLELLPIILDSAHSSGDARILFLSSSAHFFGMFDPDNMNGDHDYREFKFYCHSKLYNVMTAYALQRRLKNVGITVSAIDPGLVKIDTESERSSKNKLVEAVNRLGTLTSNQRNIYDGAATSLRAAVDPDLKSQQCFYYADTKAKQPSVASRKESAQEQLWEMSINAVKGYLSPEVLQRYQSAPQQSLEQSAGATTSTEAISTVEATASGTPEN